MNRNFSSCKGRIEMRSARRMVTRFIAGHVPQLSTCNKSSRAVNGVGDLFTISKLIRQNAPDGRNVRRTAQKKVTNLTLWQIYGRSAIGTCSEDLRLDQITWQRSFGRALPAMSPVLWLAATPEKNTM